MKNIIFTAFLISIFSGCNAMNYNPQDPAATLCVNEERCSVHITAHTGGTFSAAKLDLPNCNKPYSVFLTCAHGFVNAMYDAFDDPILFADGMMNGNNVASKRLFAGPSVLSNEYEVAAEEYRGHVTSSVNNHNGVVHDYYLDTVNRDIMKDVRCERAHLDGVRKTLLGRVSKTFITFRLPDLYLPFDIALAFGRPHASDRTDFSISTSSLPEVWCISELALKDEPISIEAHGFPSRDVGREYKFYVKCALSQNHRWLISDNQFSRGFINDHIGMSGGPCFILDKENNSKILCGVLSGFCQRRLYIKTIPSQLIEFANSLH